MGQLTRLNDGLPKLSPSASTNHSTWSMAPSVAEPSQFSSIGVHSSGSREDMLSLVSSQSP